METILAAFITGLLALVGVIVTNSTANKRLTQDIHTAQVVSDAKIEELTREVRLHNSFAQRVPILETQLENLHRRIEALEKERSST